MASVTCTDIFILLTRAVILPFLFYIFRFKAERVGLQSCNDYVDPVGSNQFDKSPTCPQMNINFNVKFT